MIVRIVKMTFRIDKTDNFLEIFRESREKIAAFEGCEQVELLHDIDNPQVYFTRSLWQSPGHLEKYRQSELFQSTWARTKVLFADKPQAWSLKQAEI